DSVVGRSVGSAHVTAADYQYTHLFCMFHFHCHLMLFVSSIAASPSFTMLSDPLEGRSRNVTKNTTSTTAAMPAGINQTPCQSNCMAASAGNANHSVISPETYEPISMPTPYVAKVINPCAALRIRSPAARST